MIDLTQIIAAIAGLAVVILAARIVPYIRTRIKADQWDQLQAIAHVAVNAAEQLGLRVKAMDKYNYAQKYVKVELQKMGISYDEVTIEAAIEAAVIENFPKE